MHKVTTAAALAAMILAAGAALVADGHPHVIAAPKDAQWGPAPPFLPAGAQLAVLSGDPTKPVPYAVRLKLPAGYAIGAHSHPTDENVVVTTGALTFGMGDKLTKAAGNKTLPVGGYALMPASMNHFAYTTGAETTIVLYGVGPVEFKYVNPKDDPRNATKSQ
ncbi:MAG TPA: cupin domain-containing protein [Vicinamibacterales bacterium]|jgi:quercetin dioxygenase-like cupin family protein|nr:cupin domain-containing protein [Vicinamibacterales bacterium]